MIIRKGTVEDFPEMYELGKRIFIDMEYGEEQGFGEYNPTMFSKLMKIAIEGGVALIAEENNKMLGFFAAIKMPCLFSASGRWMEMLWHADPQLHEITQGRVMIKLLKEAENQINGWFVLVTSLKKGISNYLDKKGYKAVEKVYVRRIN